MINLDRPLYKDELELLRKINSKGKVPIDSLTDEEQESAKVLEKDGLITHDVKSSSGNGILAILPQNYLITTKGKLYFKHQKEDKKYERKIHISYPIFVNLFCGVAGFIAGWIVRSLVNFPLFH